MDRTIPTGETTEVEIVLKASPRPGKLTRKINLWTNDRDILTTKLECVANIRAALKLEPVTVNFGNISRKADSKTTTVKVKQGDGGPINPKIVSTGHKQFEAELVPVSEGREYQLKVTAKPPWPEKYLRATMVMDTGVERAPQQKITLYARVTPRLTTNPSRFRIPYDPKRAIELPATLNWSDGEVGKVLSAFVNDPALQVKIDEKDGRQRVVMQVPAGFKSATGKRYVVTIRTDDPAAKTVTVPVYASRAPRPMPNRPAPRAGATRAPGSLSGTGAKPTPKPKAEAAPKTGAAKPAAKPATAQPAGG